MDFIEIIKGKTLSILYFHTSYNDCNISNKNEKKLDPCMIFEHEMWNYKKCQNVANKNLSRVVILNFWRWLSKYSNKKQNFGSFEK